MQTCGLMRTHVGLMWTHVGLMWTHVALMWTHVALMWTHVGLMCRVPHFGTLSTMCTHVCLEITHFVSTFQYPELLARASRALSREGPHTQHLLGPFAAIAQNSSLWSFSMLVPGANRQHNWGLRRACNSGDGRLWAGASIYDTNLYAYFWVALSELAGSSWAPPTRSSSG